MGISRKVGVSQVAPLLSGLLEVFMTLGSSYWLLVRAKLFLRPPGSQCLRTVNEVNACFVAGQPGADYLRTIRQGEGMG